MSGVSKLAVAAAAQYKSSQFESSSVYLQSTGVYQHVSEVLQKLTTEKPNNALEIFEHVSVEVKHARGSRSGIVNGQGEVRKEVQKGNENVEQQHALLKSGIAVCRLYWLDIR